MIDDTFIEATLTPQIKHFTISTLPLDIYMYQYLNFAENSTINIQSLIFQFDHRFLKFQ